MFDQTTDAKLLEWVREVTTGWGHAADEMAHNLSDNPGRISRAYRAMLSGYAVDPAKILKITVEVPPSGHLGLVGTKHVPFLSFCVHHFLPFFGTIDIVYEPGAYIIGIGKLPRLVDCRAKRFQLQELLVKEIAEDMMKHAKTKGIYVRASAQHMCVCYRGPEHPTVVNTTTYSLGTLNDLSRQQELITALR